MDQTFWGVMQITLIHALRHSPPPIEASFERLWPDARLRNILDDGLSTCSDHAGLRRTQAPSHHARRA